MSNFWSNRRYAALLLVSGACIAEDVREDATSVSEQAGVNMQGVNMQGVNMQGVNMQGVNMQGFELANATLGGGALSNLRVERGELVAESAGVTIRGTQLAGATLEAEVHDAQGASIYIPYRIAAVIPEVAAHDPTGSGNTYLYTIEQWVADTATWQPACAADYDGRRVAIPVAATWDATGARVESAAQFTFACTTGVIAKCYRWGYRPWLTGYGGASFVDLHQTCTRLARADYCGIGVPGTRDGTAINVWDRLPAPGPIQKHGLLPPVGMLFEAGWDPGGAVCLSLPRWALDLTDGLQIAQLCPDRLVPPGLLGATVCNTVSQVLGQAPDAILFNESYLNIDLL